MKRTIWLTCVLGAVASALLLPTGARGACALGLDVHGVIPEYDLFADAEQGLLVNFDVTHAAGDSCAYFVTFSTGGATSYDRRMMQGGNLLSYQLYSTASKTGVLKALPALPAEVISGSVTTDEPSPEALSLYIDLPTHQIRPAGTYTDICTLTLYQGTVDGEHTQVSSTGLSISTTLSRQIELSILDVGAPFNPSDATQSLDFGELEAGKALGFDLRVRGNTGYSVTMLSERQGRLRLAGDPLRANTTVYYTLKVDGVARNLDGVQAIEVATGSGLTTVSGALHPAMVTIGSVTGKAAGLYQDNITITVATTE